MPVGDSPTICSGVPSYAFCINFNIPSQSRDQL
jgi:hypothetical protein